MTLPVTAPVKPMLAKSAKKIPAGDNWLFEPKWDGFRALAFRDGDDCYLQSRDCKPLNRYFPELAEPLLAQLPERCVVDGEIVIAGPGGLEFESLLMRIHPAASRVAKLAAARPASFVVWDLLCLGDDDLRGIPFSERRAKLEAALADATPPLHVTPITTDRELAADWFDRFEGAGLDGVMAKAADGIYEPGKRVMHKIKHKRTTDCVVAGFRWHKNGPGTMLGSMLLGLYDDEGVLHHVGVAASFKEARRYELVEELAPLRENAADGHPWGYMLPKSSGDQSDGDSGQRVPGAKSRWNRGKSLAWEPLRPELCVEVSYDHMQGTRFRHTAHFVRWRPDKSPRECTYGQLEVTAPYELSEIFAQH
jgi:ATP-dependent DNA ligase